MTAGCQSHPCREPRAPELDRTKAPESSAGSIDGKSGAASDGTKAATGGTPAASAGSNTGAAEPNLVRIYKLDGSRQCEKKPGVAIDIMERELAGIAVHSRDKRKDGLMHVQVCGSPSGMINVYEIEMPFLKQAEQRGFKRLED